MLTVLYDAQISSRYFISHPISCNNPSYTNTLNNPISAKHNILIPHLPLHTDFAYNLIDKPNNSSRIYLACLVTFGIIFFAYAFFFICFVLQICIHFRRTVFFESKEREVVS